jgi:FSR family fosmidomycin resistance protein-like MFS transporter
MNSATLRLVLLVSCAHGLVHVYEHSFASVEQLVGEDAEFSIPPERQKQVTGTLGSCLRFPFGVCALLAGWLADRWGAKRLLIAYLLGASVACGMVWLSPGLAALYISMFALGVSASIYHPAGVGLISLHTNPENRTMALGYHGIFGSAGIAAGPFLAGIVLACGASWRGYYLVLTVPGVVLALVLLARLSHAHANSAALAASSDGGGNGEDDAHWGAYATLLTVAALAGFVYAAILNFMPRYLDGAGLDISGIPDRAMRNYLTGSILMLGVIGQYTAGRIARPHSLERLMACAFFATAPCILWMGFAQGPIRLLAAACFSPLFFMHQPLFNSLVAKYVPRRRRSLCYGLSFTLGFGIGSFGPTFSGFAKSDLLNYATLAAILTLAGCLALGLWWNELRRRAACE